MSPFCNPLIPLLVMKQYLVSKPEWIAFIVGFIACFVSLQLIIFVNDE